MQAYVKEQQEGGGKWKKGSRSKQVVAAGQMRVQNEMGPMAWQGQFGLQHYWGWQAPAMRGMNSRAAMEEIRDKEVGKRDSPATVASWGIGITSWSVPTTTSIWRHFNRWQHPQKRAGSSGRHSGGNGIGGHPLHRQDIMIIRNKCNR
jgi:hypothetical protein